METSIAIARIIAIAYLSIGFGLIISKSYYENQFERIVNNAGVLYLGGFMGIVFGSLIIEGHNFWVNNWTVLITIIGWLSLIKGIVLLIFPNQYLPLIKPFYKPKNINGFAIISLALGLLFGYFGFFS
jgi:hypothetical protein